MEAVERGRQRWCVKHWVLVIFKPVMAARLRYRNFFSRMTARFEDIFLLWGHNITFPPNDQRVIDYLNGGIKTEFVAQIVFLGHHVVYYTVGGESAFKYWGSSGFNAALMMNHEPCPPKNCRMWSRYNTGSIFKHTGR